MILVDCLSDVSLLAKPRAVPATDDAEAIAYWISLLSHGSLLVNSVITCIDIDRQIASSLTDAIAAALSAGAHPLERRSLVDVDLADVELPLVGVLLILLLPVGDCTLESAGDVLGGALIRVSEDSQCLLTSMPRTISITRRILRGEEAILVRLAKYSDCWASLRA